MPQIKNATLLIAEDNEPNRYALRRTLSRAGFSVHEVTRGDDILSALPWLNPDLLITDVNMPGMSGFEVCRLIKSNPATSNLPILMISASSVESTDQARGLDTGADAYLIEPIDPAVLIATVRALLRARRAEEALRRREARLVQVLGSITDAYFELDSQWRFVDLNAVAEREFFGRPAAELIGRTIWDAFPVCRGTEFYRQYHAAMAENRPAHFEGYSPIQGQWWEAHAYPREGDHLEAYLRDITDRKRGEQELARSNLELEQFASTISHDLRSPLNSLSGAAQLLTEVYGDQLLPEAREAVQYIHQGVAHMSRLISSLLTYSRVGRGDLQLKTCSSEIALKEAVRNLRATIESTNAEILHDPLPEMRSDCTLLTQVFQNLIENAIKYAGERQPKVHISAQAADDEWIFSVADNGIGIAPENYERIFHVFERLGGGDAGYSSLGLGLTTCKRIVEKHGGRIWVESVSGKGSTFHFSMPLRK